MGGESARDESRKMKRSEELKERQVVQIEVGGKVLRRVRRGRKGVGSNGTRKGKG